MNIIITLLKMEFINRFGKITIKDKKAVAKFVSSLLFFGMIFIGTLWGATVFFSMFNKAGLAYEALVIFFTVVFVFLLFTNISNTIKVLYYKGDNEILMRFPVDGWQVFWAKTIFLLLAQVLTVSLIVVPFLVAYGNVVPVKASFYVAIPFVILLMVFIPFFLSNMLAIPFMHLSNKIRHKFGFIIISLALLMTSIFFVYTLVFEKMVIYLKANQSFTVFSENTVVFVSNLVKYFIPTKYFAGMMLGKFEVTRIIKRETLLITVGDGKILSYSIMFLLLALSVVGAVMVIKKLYKKTLLANIEIEGSAFRKKVKNKVRPIFSTLFYKEFVQVFRSINYSFQYFVLACSMPVMVFFCNRIAIAIGTNDIGYRIIPGLTLLIMLIFNTIIISFSASSVTREGSNFYHTKVMPVSVRMQLFVKFVMYNLVSFIANTITIAVIIFTKQMSPDINAKIDFMKPLAIYVIAILFSIGLTLISMRLDINKPKFNLSGEGELVNSNANTTSSVLIGFLFAILLGMLGMIIPYMFLNIGFDMLFYVLLSISFLFFITSILIFCIKTTSSYNKIM